MNQQTFASILDAPATDSVRPPAVPAGHYIATIKGLPRRDKSSKKQTEFIEYKVGLLGVYEENGTSDVDAEELAAFVEVNGPLNTKEMNLTFYMTEKSAFRHREFLEDDLGMDMEGKSHWEGAQETPGSQFVVNIRQKPTEDGKGVYSEIASTAPLAD